MSVLIGCLSVLTALLVAGQVKGSAQACPSVKQTLSGATRAQYAQLVTANFPSAYSSTHLRITQFMENGDWSAVFAKCPTSERVVFFFHLRAGKPVYADTWGGVAAGTPRR